MKWLATVIVVGVALLGSLLGILWLEHRTDITLPQPTGPFAVGRTLSRWIDHGHADLLAPVQGTERELMVWIWYPAEPATEAKPADYLPAPWRQAVARQSGVLISQFLTRDLSRVHAHSNSDAPMSPARQAYPVVIMRPGLAALTTQYSTLAENLASHGYVVVGLDAPYRTTLVVLPDGRVISRADSNNVELFDGPGRVEVLNKLLAAWCADVGFVLDRLEQMNAADPSGRFKGRLDMQRVGVFGHSLGGSTAAQFCHDDSRCKAVIDVDGAPLGSVIKDGLRQPFMVLLSDHDNDKDPQKSQILANLQSIYDSVSADQRWWITIRGANHFSFSDQVLLKSPLLVGALHRLGIMGKLNERDGLQITGDSIQRFFAVYLQGQPPDSLQNLATKYPEVQLR